MTYFPMLPFVWYYFDYIRVASRTFRERAMREVESFDLWHSLVSFQRRSCHRNNSSIHLLQMTKDESGTQKLTVADLSRETSVGIVAGADTVANAAVCTIYLLLQNPDCLAKARVEIDNLVNGGTEPWADMEVHESMPYLNACM